MLKSDDTVSLNLVTSAIFLYRNRFMPARYKVIFRVSHQIGIATFSSLAYPQHAGTGDLQYSPTTSHVRQTLAHTEDSPRQDRITRTWHGTRVFGGSCAEYSNLTWMF
jgi:hypothetical protein